MALTGYSIPATLTDDAGNTLFGTTVTVTGPSAYSGTAASSATTGILRLGPLPAGDYTVTYGTRSIVVPVIAAGADVLVDAAADVTARAALKASNLSDLASASTARTNLGLGGAATLNVGTTAGTAAAGDDSRFTAVAHNTQTASYTLVLADAGKLVEMNVATANTLTVPPNSSVAFPVGTVIGWRQYGAGQVTLTPGAGVTIRASGTKLKSGAQYSEGSLTKRGANEWVAAGDLVA